MTTPKYRNKPTFVDGIRFDSQKEARRYGELKLMERAGEISGLELQPRFPIVVKGVKVCTVVPDFTYLTRDGERITEDVKSPVTAKNPVYRLKKKLMLAVHGVEIKEV